MSLHGVSQTLLGVPILGIVLGGPYEGPLILGNYHIVDVQYGGDHELELYHVGLHPEPYNPSTLKP